MVAANGPAPGRLASVYSEVQTNQVLHTPPLRSVLCSNFLVVDGPARSAASNHDEIARLFPTNLASPRRRWYCRPSPRRPGHSRSVSCSPMYRLWAATMSSAKDLGLTLLVEF